jgi:hypothetical protein
VLKSKPHASQNCPVLAAPQFGHEPAPASGEPGGDCPADGVAEVATVPLIRMPQTSQKSSLAES